MPERSAVGRSWSNRMVRWNCGIRTEDSQCGFRAYPLRILENVNVREERFEFEAACLVRCGWIGVDAVDVPVQAVSDMHMYPIDGIVALGDQETKQIALFQAPKVKVTKEYRILGNERFFCGELSDLFSHRRLCVCQRILILGGIRRLWRRIRAHFSWQIAARGEQICTLNHF